MTPKFRRVAVFVGTAAIAAGAGIGVAAQGDSSTPDRSSGAPGLTRPQDGGGPPGIGGGASGLSAVADQLGVSETRLETAMRNARPTDPTDPAAGGGPDAMMEAVAEELGLEADTVRKAFESVLGTQGGPGAPPAGGQQATPPATDGQTTMSLEVGTERFFFLDMPIFRCRSATHARRRSHRRSGRRRGVARPHAGAAAGRARRARLGDHARREGGLSRQRLNYHLRALERHGLVELVEERRKGNCTERVLQATAASYVISPAAFAAVAPDPARAPDQVSAHWMLALAGQLVRDVGDLIAGATRARKPVPTYAIDSEIRFASASDRAAFAAELGEAVAQLAGKYHDATAAGGREHRLVVALHPSITRTEDTQEQEQ